jgi:hypothetical protein
MLVCKHAGRSDLSWLAIATCGIAAACGLSKREARDMHDATAGFASVAGGASPSVTSAGSGSGRSSRTNGGRGNGSGSGGSGDASAGRENGRGGRNEVPQGGASGADDVAAGAASDPRNDGGSPDGGAPCEFTDPFTSVVALTELNSAEDDDVPRLSADELTIYFLSERPQAAGLPRPRNIWTATRTSRKRPFGEPYLVLGANQTGGNTFGLSLTSDALTLFIDADPAGGSEIFYAARPNVDAAFSAPSLVELGTTEYRGAPWVTPDGSRLYFSAPLGYSSSLHATEMTDGHAGTPVLLQGVDTPASEYGLCMSADELTIYFGSDRREEGKIDLWRARRTSKAAPFAGVTDVDEVNSTAQDLPGTLSTDGCRLYFMSRRDGGDANLYVAEKLPTTHDERGN